MLDEVCDIAVLFVENLPKEEYNKKKLDELNHEIIIIDSIDEVPMDSPQEFVHMIRKIEQNKTGGFEKRSAWVMVACNVDLKDRHINRQIDCFWFCT